ncbi:pilus assembly protein TadG-related protein [Emcibacter sp. SYSU 3D8]|uniref:pilus assembly protein TadG-related protein n=1 Tax=Emcibacter sp. SYSU 3D8 TaxID=3133969 RepID=UPI0031FE6DAB
MKGWMLRALRRAVRRSHAAVGDRSGNISLVAAVCLPVFLSVLGLSFEVAQWYMTQRAMQNAADSASVSAAMSGGANFDIEARAVAAQYGYIHGIDHVSVDVTDGTPCPSGAGTCYQVTITKPVPLYLMQLIGYQGNVTINGTHMVALSSGATAEQSLEKREYCILTLAGLPGHSNTEGFRCNGCPKADLTGCNIMSNNTATCNGHTTLADVGDAHGNNNGCGIEQNSNQTQVIDPYDQLAAHIPADPCGSIYPQSPARRSDPDLPPSNQWSGAKVVNGNVSICGDLELTGDVDVTNSSGDGGVLIIWNGKLDIGNFRLRTVSGYLTIVFAGVNGVYAHAPAGDGTLDFSAPISGNWSGMAIYQAPNLTSGVDITEAGNRPTWNLTGMVYVPHASVTLSGAVNKSATNGASCFGMVVDNIRVNGTGLSLNSCDAAGLELPFRHVPGRGKLVH